MSVTISFLRERRFELGVTVFVALSLVLMMAYPHLATVPLHCSWIAVILLYGARSWGQRPTNIVLVVLGAASGVVFCRLAAIGAIDVEEVAEAPLMAGAFFATVWLVRRRDLALDDERAGRAIEYAQARQTCHDLRSPLTVARGYAELLVMRSADPEVRADAHLVIREMDRVAAIANRLRDRA